MVGDEVARLRAGRPESNTETSASKTQAKRRDLTTAQRAAAALDVTTEWELYKNATHSPCGRF
jgi:hypothetical protein